MHDSNAIGQSEDFIEVVRDQQHGGALGARIEQLLVHERHRANVESPRRLVGNDQQWRMRGSATRVSNGAEQRAAQHQFLHVAARQRPHSGVETTRGTHVEALDHSPRKCACRSAKHHAAARETLGMVLSHRILPERQVADRAHGMPILGDARDTGGDPVARRCTHDGTANAHAAGVRRAHAAEDLGQRLLAIAGDARNGRDRAGMQRQ